jgi:hypothetical protein
MRARIARRLAIKSADPMDAPRIEPRYLDKETDRKALVAGLRIAREIYREPPFRDLWETEAVPGAERASEADLLDYAQRTGGTVFHASGTCRMGTTSSRSSIRASRARRRAPARDRRLGHADRHLGQYQRGRAHDCREGRGAPEGSAPRAVRHVEVEAPSVQEHGPPTCAARGSGS